MFSFVFCFCVYFEYQRPKHFRYILVHFCVHFGAHFCVHFGPYWPNSENNKTYFIGFGWSCPGLLIQTVSFLGYKNWFCLAKYFLSWLTKSECSRLVTRHFKSFRHIFLAWLNWVAEGSLV